jgi:hypothetical protein
MLDVREMIWYGTYKYLYINYNAPVRISISLCRGETALVIVNFLIQKLKEIV